MNTHYLRVALYARVSSEQQAKEHTIASQIEAIKHGSWTTASLATPNCTSSTTGTAGVR